MTRDTDVRFILFLVTDILLDGQGPLSMRKLFDNAYREVGQFCSLCSDVIFTIAKI